MDGRRQGDVEELRADAGAQPPGRPHDAGTRGPHLLTVRMVLQGGRLRLRVAQDHAVSRIRGHADFPTPQAVGKRVQLVQGSVLPPDRPLHHLRELQEPGAALPVGDAADEAPGVQSQGRGGHRDGHGVGEVPAEQGMPHASLPAGGSLSR